MQAEINYVDFNIDRIKNKTIKLIDSFNINKK